jgi:metal-dependent amidase/aminoacylase/carboxypeptidase family protein
MKKYLLPWSFINYTYSRKNLCNVFVADIWEKATKKYTIAIYKEIDAIKFNMIRGLRYNSILEAQNAADQFLIELGFILISEEDAGKYKVLL